MTAANGLRHCDLNSEVTEKDIEGQTSYDKSGDLTTFDKLTMAVERPSNRSRSVVVTTA